ncbi:MAG: DUF177 domain-containing protein [Anaerolineae bacterium]|nr:DUF177 domain-containing protein [Anaerolineae bacterium]MDW8173447.1 DUF177 domain-containing protein [Anaerolineae bacterium]
MTKPPNLHLLPSRVLRVNVGFLLSEGPAHHQDSRLDIPDPIRVADDLIINHISGPLRLSRAKEGILVQLQAQAGVDDVCSRCLTPFERTVLVEVEELYAHPASDFTEFSVGGDNNLDLAPLLRAEILIALDEKALCYLDCRGLCSTCGVNLNEESCTCANHAIDPRLAKLRQLLDLS